MMAHNTGSVSSVSAAMEHIYGPFDSDNLESISSWQPPALSPKSSRYLWTDAFAVVNFITLSKLSTSTTEQELWKIRAKRLIHSVHDVLGRSRDGSRRLRGATDEKPLSGGLRIGKDEETGPDQDGQYHHYLSLWMFALNRYSICTKDKTYNDLAIQLAKGIQSYFITKEAGNSRPKLYWKMSVDLPDGALVESEGNTDAYVGYTVFTLLQRTDGAQSTILQAEIADYESIVLDKLETEGIFKSHDTLDIGMALWTAHFLKDSHEWARKLSQGAFTSLNTLQRSRYFALSTFEDDIEAGKRLPFRDFGTAMGIRCYDYSKSSAMWEGLADNVILAYSDPETGVLGNGNQDGLKAINLVMFAAALEPGAFKDGFLEV